MPVSRDAAVSMDMTCCLPCRHAEAIRTRSARVHRSPPVKAMPDHYLCPRLMMPVVISFLPFQTHLDSHVYLPRDMGSEHHVKRTFLRSTSHGKKLDKKVLKFAARSPPCLISQRGARFSGHKSAAHVKMQFGEMAV